VPLTARARSGRGGRAAAECARLARSQLALRCPSFAEAPVVADRSGPIDITPDRCAIIDRVQPEGLYLAVGMSGSGFKKGPAIGQCVAEMVLHGESRTVPIPEFRFSRFAENDLIRGEVYSGPFNLVH